MATKYICCQCDEDVTAQVVSACRQGSDTRAAFQAPTMVFKGMNLVHATGSVFVTCSNKHHCEFPCSGVSHG